MKPIQKVLVMLSLDKKHRDMLETTFKEWTFVYEKMPTQQHIDEADAIIGNPSLSLRLNQSHLQFLQLTSAGSDAYVKEGLLNEKTKLMNASGAYGVNISEHMLSFVLYFYKHLDVYRDHMKEGHWKREADAREIMGSRTLIVGLGDLGGQFALRMHALGSYVSGIKRTISQQVEGVDELHTMADLDSELEKADIVALCLPQSAKTYHVMNLERLLKMKKDAVLINVGRGSAIDTESLMTVMNQGYFLGVGLDVTEEEPLNQEHPLWHQERLLLTPHVSGGLHLERNLDFVVKLAIRNLQHYLHGEALENEVNRQTGYRYH